MEAIIEEMFRRITGVADMSSNLDLVNHEIEQYWKHILESTEDLFDLDTTRDHDELADDIWDILFEHNEEYKFDYDYYNEIRDFDSNSEPFLEDIPLMINYFNTYFEETYGAEELKYQDLNMNKIFMYYAHAYAGYNRIDHKIKEWLDENLTSDTDTETTEVPLWDGGKEEGEIID